MPRHTNIVAVFLILQKDDKILLLQRANTGYHDGEYAVVSGHVEPGETFTIAMIREAREEAGIVLTPDNLKVVHVQHRKSDNDPSERVDVYFSADSWSGDVKNMEPDKCSDLRWFSQSEFPKNIVPCVQFALAQYGRGSFYSEYGWK